MNEPRCRIGILGGIASGKSTLAKLFSEMGAQVVDADRIGHQILERPDIREQVRGLWGDQVMTAQGAVDRARLGKLVFGQPEELQKLNRIVHPPLVRELEESLNALHGPVVLDAALLDEFSLTSWCDHLIFVEARPDLRRNRASSQRGWSPGEMERREALQHPLEAKKRKAETVIENNGSIEDFRREACRVWSVMGMTSSCPP
ncbi:MAG: dephospho-CoA kinase [Planctomycetes bacterium]|nr:dephospho-CoA kinase [Planctomycetota bacterium]